MGEMCSYGKRQSMILRMSMTPGKNTWADTTTAHGRFDVDGAAKLRPIGFGSARHFAEDLPGTGSAKLAHLCSLALPVGRYPRIAVNQQSSSRLSRAAFAVSPVEKSQPYLENPGLSSLVTPADQSEPK